MCISEAAAVEVLGGLLLVILLCLRGMTDGEGDNLVNVNG